MIEIKAPARGRYDRTTSRSDRLAMQRERLLKAAAQAFADGELSVTRVVALARVGRATFYEFFDDAEHALLVLRERVLDRASRELANVLELPATRPGLDAVCEVWIELIRRDPSGALAALDARSADIAPLTERFARVLTSWIRALRATNASQRSEGAAHASSSRGRESARERVAATEAGIRVVVASDTSTVADVESEAMWFMSVLAQAAAVRAARAELDAGSPGMLESAGDLPRSLATALAALLDVRDVTAAVAQVTRENP